MDKIRFLRREYKRIIASGVFVSQSWCLSEDRLPSDMVDRTPNYRSGRFLAPIDQALGCSSDDVELRFETSARLKPKQALKTQRVREKAAAKKPKPENSAAAQLRENPRLRPRARRGGRRWLKGSNDWNSNIGLNTSSGSDLHDHVLHLEQTYF
jgi:hypothetical protein